MASNFGFGINDNFSSDSVKLTAEDSAGDPAGESQSTVGFSRVGPAILFVHVYFHSLLQK